MRDTQRPLRAAIYSVISGVVLYNGSPIKFYDEKKKAGATDNVYGLFGTQQTAISQVIDDSWITDELITIELTHRSEFEVTKDFLDDVADQMLQVLMPTRLNDALPDPTLMQIQSFELDNAITRSVEITATETITSKFVTFSCKMVQQS